MCFFFLFLFSFSISFVAEKMKTRILDLIFMLYRKKDYIKDKKKSKLAATREDCFRVIGFLSFLPSFIFPFFGSSYVTYVHEGSCSFQP